VIEAPFQSKKSCSAMIGFNPLRCLSKWRRNYKSKTHMNIRTRRSDPKWNIASLIWLVLTSSAIMALAEAVTPPPDGGYSNLCTAAGFGAPEAQPIEIAQLKSDLAEPAQESRRKHRAERQSDCCSYRTIAAGDRTIRPSELINSSNNGTVTR
jgi:hypothetical protein